ncbi:pyocin knob domain-containing protein [Abiotrophia defectiva]|uniref:pyocin knob domain-containing protein n=1 Tax=Abiotrophia defectiva TaxID=46125 RepID=UPI0026F17C79|nr:pyocin knob domain-containing protein [Abiotrophia defectiva]
MAFSQLQLTNAGTRELAKGGALVLTKIALGDGQMGDVATASGLARKVCEVTPTVTSDNEYQVIEGVFDNIALDITAEKNIQEVGVFGKVGEGADVLLYYAKGNAFVFPPKTQQQMTVRIPFRVKIVGNREVTVSLNTQMSGMATADSVNRVSETLGKLKSGTSIEQALDLPGLKVLLGSTGKQRAPQDLDTLGTPGIYWYEQSHNASSKGIASGYGFILVFSNMVGSPGQAGNFTWQVFYGTNGRIWVRTRVNNGAWSVQPVASGEYLTNTLKRLGLDEWGLGFNIATCSSGTNFGTFLASSAVPIGFNIVKDNNPPMKEVFVWKSSNTYAYCFAPRHNGGFLVNSLQNGRFGEWRDLGQGLTVQVSSNQDFGDYLRSNAVPIGISAQKDSRTGAFGTVTKVDNNNIYFTGAMREQGKTYQVAYAIVDGVVPSAFTKWALT